MRQRIIIGSRPDDIPEGWDVYNAPRPIYGHKEWVGDFLSGVFYAAINPEGDRAEWMAQRNTELDAARIVWVDEQTAVDDSLAYYQTNFPKQAANIDLDDPKYIEWLLQNYVSRHSQEATR